MQVLLRHDVNKLGRVGDLVDVAPGYARNYLLPKGIAVPVTHDNLKAMEKAREERHEREKEEMARVTHQAELMDGFLCYVSARATEKGHLFGSVGPQDIATQLAESGFEGIRSSAIGLETPIEELGDYEVEVMLHPEVRATITVRVAQEQEED